MPRQFGVDPEQSIRYHATMVSKRCALAMAVLASMLGCAYGHTVSSIPLDQRLAARFGHRMDIVQGASAPRNLQWDEERLRVHLAVGRYVAEHPAIPPSIVEALRQQRMVPGLTKEQVRLLWGAPERVRHDTEHGHEFWYYRVAESPQRCTTVQLIVCEGLVACITRP